MIAMTERRPDSQQLTRQWAMLRLLSEAKRPYAVKDLAEQLQVSKATIERDLATFAQEEEVEIHFDAEIAWRIEERTYHPSEIKERLADGTLRYRLRSSAQWEIVRWVQSHGARAELVAPASWRDVVRKNAELTLARYAE